MRLSKACGSCVSRSPLRARFAIALGAALALAAGGSHAAPIVNGSLVGDGYGPARSVQAVQTFFGDNQSELDAAYATVLGGRLYLTLTGNLEANFNTIEIFIDSQSGGENVLSGIPGNGGTSVMAGLRFDTGFDADYHIFVRRGFTGVINTFDLDFARLGTSGSSSYTNLFGGQLAGSGSTGTGLNLLPIEVAYDGSNVAGVTGGTAAANQLDALAVATGLELSVALSDLGSPAGLFEVAAFVNNGNHNYASNQFLGPLAPPQGNLGGDGLGNFTGMATFDLNGFAGNQFFVVPEPSSVLLAAGGILGAALLRRRAGG